MWTDVIVGTRITDNLDIAPGPLWLTGNFFTINQPNTPQKVQVGEDPVHLIDIYYSSASASDPSTNGTIFGAHCTLSIVPTYACIVGIANGNIMVNQQLNVDVQFNADGLTDRPISVDGFKTNCSAHNVIVADEYEVSVDQNGRLQIVPHGQRQVKDLSTTFTPTSEGTEICQTDQLAAQIKSRFSDPAPVDFSSVDLNGMQDFIFPGGKVFTFKSAVFSQSNDLICSLTYVDPGAAAPPTAMMQVSSTQSEWQYYFEKENFKHLILSQNDLRVFRAFVNKKRQQFITWIWLRLELSTYDCSRCAERQSQRQIRDDNMRFSFAIHRLFCMLSSWNNKGNSGFRKEGITVELSAHSPSDAKHCFKDLQLRMNDTAWAIKSVRTMERSPFNDHGWVNGVRLQPLTDRIISRLLGPSEGIKLCLRKLLGVLPKVSIVSSFIIRRQFYRHFSVSKTLKPIINSLTNLREFRYEPWRGVTTRTVPGREIRDRENLTLFAKVLRDKPSLKVVSFNEDVDWHIHRPYRNNEPACQGVGQAAAEGSRGLEQFHGAMGLDARDFFHGFQPNIQPRPKMQWPHLKFITLSSKSLNPGYADHLIRTAASAALHMPSLVQMELWNADLQSAAVFLYVVRDRPVIRLRSSWGGCLSEEAIQSWRQVAERKTYFRGLRVRLESIPWDIVQKHDQVLPWVELRGRMLTRGSLEQIYRAIRMFEEE